MGDLARGVLVEVRPGLEHGAPGPQLEADEVLLEQVRPGGPGLVRWYVVDRPALVLGFAQRTRADHLVDRVACVERGIEVLERRSGGGLVLLDETMLCLTVALPATHPLALADLTESYRWLGDRFTAGVRSIGAEHARRVEVAEARQEAAALAARRDATAGWVRAVCYAGPSPHEVAVGGAKLVGLAQVRRRQAALFQAGLLLRDQSPLADLLQVEDAPTRAALRHELQARTIGLDTLLVSPGGLGDVGLGRLRESNPHEAALASPGGLGDVSPPEKKNTLQELMERLSPYLLGELGPQLPG